MRIVPSEFEAKRAYLIGMKGGEVSFRSSQSTEIDE